MVIKIKNWKLAFLALIFFCLFNALGIWQVSRANQKKILLEEFAKRTLKPPLTIKDLTLSKDLRFYRLTVAGNFDNQHAFLLDNKIYHGQVGYEIYTPFFANGINVPILIDRGFVPMGNSRTHLPPIASIPGKVTLTGMLNLPPTYVTFGAIDDHTTSWPLRIEFVNLSILKTLLNYPLYPKCLSGLIVTACHSI